MSERAIFTDLLKANTEISSLHNQITSLRVQLAECEAQAVQREREATYTLVRNAYNEGFTEGMKEHTKYNGGKPWEWSDALKSVNARRANATYNDNRKG
jgi:hypothetical protein